MAVIVLATHGTCLKNQKQEADLIYCESTVDCLCVTY